MTGPLIRFWRGIPIDLSKATPRPWTMNKYGSIGAGESGTEPIIASVEGLYGGDAKYGDHLANAALIVLGANAFDPDREEYIRELVAAARRARAALVVAVREECGVPLDAHAITALDAALAHFPEKSDG